jgi:hypothetical protein
MRKPIPGKRGLILITAATLGTAIILASMGEWVAAIAGLVGLAVGWHFVLAT